MARDIAEKVGKQIGQTVIIENAAGAGGTIGATKAARAQPDGYTFLVGHMGYMGAGPSLYKKLNYDPVKSFEAVFRFPDTPLVLLVGPSSPYKNAADLIAAAKANPGKINFGHAGVGSTSHLIAALFASKAGIEVTQVAYKGAAPAMNDLMGGQVDAMFDQSNTALPQVQSGRLKALALTSLTPMPQQYPGVSPLAEKLLRFGAKGAGSVFSFDIKGSREQGKAFIEALKIFSHLANVGDCRSLVIHPASTTHFRMSDEALAAGGIGPGTIRLSIGLEDADDLIDDLKRALKAAEKVGA